MFSLTFSVSRRRSNLVQEREPGNEVGSSVSEIKVRSRNHSYIDELEKTLLRTKYVNDHHKVVQICGKATHFPLVSLK